MRVTLTFVLRLEGIIRLLSAAKTENLEAAVLTLINLVNAVSMALDILLFVKDV
jgi:hypothetical protein